ncbi:hypothetical protein FZEAL_4280 [Fusarium zealandicum]|uniref:Uncharacterized protein n=1 Tax=Fusarium zealandicum TaxID=1053134 RepID=A0A8H4UMV5_9HYPO|nr:hypothetical protein FZEAL_4280 [Fusarium zealandicum]
MPNPLLAIRATYYFLTWALDHGQVPNEIRRSLELVRTCDHDLQHLIELRHECLPLLQRRPMVLRRADLIIKAAQAGLAEACELVERCRPEAHGGKTPLSNQMAWMLVDSSEFRGQEAVISRHHAAVLAELSFLRQIALLAPVGNSSEVEQHRGARQDVAVFDNVALLGDILGDPSGTPYNDVNHHRSYLTLSNIAVSTSKQPPLSQTRDPAYETPSIIISDAKQDSTRHSSKPWHPLPPPYKRSPSQPLGLSMESSAPEVVHVNTASSVPSRPQTASAILGTEDLAGLAFLLGESEGFTTPPTPSPPSPSVRSNSHHHHGASAPSLPTFMRTVSSYSNISSGTLPGHYTWTNTSSTTVSSISTAAAPGSHAWHSNAWAQPIAELDSSPYPGRFLGPPSELDASELTGETTHTQRQATQVNAVPVELPAEDSAIAGSALRRRSALSNRRGRTFTLQSSPSS